MLVFFSTMVPRSVISLSVEVFTFNLLACSFVQTHYKRLMGLVEAAREEYNSHLTSLQTSGSAVVISPTSTSSHSTSPTLSPQHFSSTESIDKEKGTPPQPQLLSLNVHANEFVPSITHSFNINATVFTPMLHFSSS